MSKKSKSKVLEKGFRITAAVTKSDTIPEYGEVVWEERGKVIRRCEFSDKKHVDRITTAAGFPKLKRGQEMIIIIKHGKKKMDRTE